MIDRHKNTRRSLFSALVASLLTSCGPVPTPTIPRPGERHHSCAGAPNIENPPCGDRTTQLCVGGSCVGAFNKDWTFTVEMAVKSSAWSGIQCDGPCSEAPVYARLQLNDEVLFEDMVAQDEQLVAVGRVTDGIEFWLWVARDDEAEALTSCGGDLDYPMLQISEFYCYQDHLDAKITLAYGDKTQ